MNNGENVLYQLQQLQFAFIEMKLYLDTHPFDQRVHQDLMRVSHEMNMLMPEVERYYGPLMGHGFSRVSPARWVTDPWPWELHYK